MSVSVPHKIKIDIKLKSSEPLSSLIKEQEIKLPVGVLYLPQAIPMQTADDYYTYLKENITWEAGIRSRRTGFTRKAKALDLITENYQLKSLIIQIMNKMGLIPDEVVVVVLSINDTLALLIDKYLVRGLYLNYYENGTMYTPEHSHPGTKQLVISLGATRILTLGSSCRLPMQNGDAIVFDSIKHGVPRNNDIIAGRISIAVFLQEFVLE